MANLEKIIGWIGIKKSDIGKNFEQSWEENGELIYPANKKREAMQQKYETILRDKKYTTRESTLEDGEINILPLIKNRTYVEKIFIPASDDKTNIKFIVDKKTNKVFGATYKKGKYTVREYFNTFDKNLKKYVNIKVFLTDNVQDGDYNIATISRTDAATNEILEFLDEQKLIETGKYLIT